MELKLTAAVLAGKTAFLLTRLRGNKGTSLPGMVARKLCRATLRPLAAQVRKKIIMVSGTNGKTTTCNMITDILVSAGYSVISNREGANMLDGVTTSFVMKANMVGGVDCDYAVLEVDEASMPKVLAEVSPDLVVLTNFFRDQLDRYWELEKIIRVVYNALAGQKGFQLILNADDPLVAQFGANTAWPALYYGVGRHRYCRDTSTQAREAKFCPICGQQLVYAYFHYGQLGCYHCSRCSFARPDAFVEVVDLSVTKDGTVCRLSSDKQEVSLTVRARGMYNVYNALAAVAVGIWLEVDIHTVLESLGKYQTVAGRMETYVYQGKQVFLILVKNPTGFNEVIATLSTDEGTKDVFIAVNDNEADGIDVSWLWDVDFELLSAEHQPYARFVCSGLRAEEMALRLKYAGIPPTKLIIDKNFKTAVDTTLTGTADSIYILSTYTALWPVHKIINHLAMKEG